MLRTEATARAKTMDELLDAKLVARLSQLDIASRKVFTGKMKGERRSKKRGESVEFADHRAYVVGDDLRFIDWNIFGRLDRLFLKLFLEEEDLGLHVVIDCSESMACGEPGKFLFAQRAAAALGYVGLVNLNRVAVTAIGDRAGGEGGDGENGGGGKGDDESGGVIGTVRNLRGRRRVHDLGRFVCGLEAWGGSRFDEAAKRIALTRQGKGVMVVLSDFMFKEGYERGLRYLVGRGYDVVCVQVLSPQEVEPEIAGDLRLKDVEDGDRAEVTVSAPLLKRYRANLSAYIDRLRVFCARREIALITVKSDVGVDTLLLEYLRNRGVLR